jgi:DNA-binding transcriptional MerR regulator
MGSNDFENTLYRVGEVSHLVEVDPYVLRYWEKMFPQLKPKKDENGQRIYTQSDIDIVLRIKNLLYDERYTIAGAKKKLIEESEAEAIKNDDQLLMTLRNIRQMLREVSTILEKE